MVTGFQSKNKCNKQSVWYDPTELPYSFALLVMIIHVSIVIAIVLLILVITEMVWYEPTGWVWVRPRHRGSTAGRPAPPG